MLVCNFHNKLIAATRGHKVHTFEESTREPSFFKRNSHIKSNSFLKYNQQFLLFNGSSRILLWSCFKSGLESLQRNWRSCLNPDQLNCYFYQDFEEQVLWWSCNIAWKMRVKANIDNIGWWRFGTRVSVWWERMAEEGRGMSFPSH